MTRWRAALLTLGSAFVLNALALDRSLSARPERGFRTPERYAPWENVIDPDRARSRDLWLAVQRARVTREPELTSPKLELKRNERAAVVLELAGAGGTHEPELAFLFGETLVGAGAGYVERGRAALLSALARYPDWPEAASAWRQVAIASLALGDKQQAEVALTRALHTEWDREQRVQLLSERARLSMSEGRLNAAIEDCREALGQAGAEDVGALTRWVLAVALDRDYQEQEAMFHAALAASARFGPQSTLTALELPEAAFIAPSERYYYRALSTTSQASKLVGTESHVATLQTAELMWLSYLQAAPVDTPWLSRARYHLHRVHSTLEDLVKTEEAVEDSDPDWIFRLEREERQR